MQGDLYLWIEVEESVDAHPQLAFDFLASSFQHMHCDMSFVSVGEFERGVLHLGDFALGQQPQTVDKCEISHEAMLPLNRCGRERLQFASLSEAAIHRFRVEARNQFS